MTIKIKKRSWSQVTLNEYSKIMDVISDEALSDSEKDIAIIAILAEVPEDDIWNLSVSEVKKLKEDMLFLGNNITDGKVQKYKKIKIGEWECNVLQDLQKMSYAQFVDFQTFIRDLDNKKAEVLSIFFIPVGHRYCEGYDVRALQNAKNECVSVETYRNCWFFFLKRYRSSLNRTAIYLASMLKARALLMRKSNPLKEKYRELAKMIREIPHLMCG